MSEDNRRIRGGRITPASIAAIQGAVIVYTGAGICGKMAGSCRGSVTLFGVTVNALSLTGYLWIFLEIVCLGSYALIWQQIIKRFDLSIVYANRAFAVCWSFLWGVLLFHEQVKPLNILGIAIVLCGILLVNQDAK